MVGAVAAAGALLWWHQTPGTTGKGAAPLVAVPSDRAGPPPAATAPGPADDPLSVARAVAAGLFDTAGYIAMQPLLSAHARRVATPPDRPCAAAATSVHLLDPRAAAVVAEVVVARWWLDGGGQVADSTPHVVRVTLSRRPGGHWRADDLDAA